METTESTRAEPTVAAEGAEAQERSNNRRSAWIGAGLTALVLAGLLGYIIGLHVGHDQNSTSAASGSTTGATTAPSGSRSKAVTGSIATVSGMLVSLTDQSNGSKITVELTPLTTIRVVDYGTIASLKPGGNITVAGRRLADGTLRARTVTVNPTGPAAVPGLAPSPPTTAAP